MFMCKRINGHLVKIQVTNAAMNAITTSFGLVIITCILDCLQLDVSTDWVFDYLFSGHRRKRGLFGPICMQTHEAWKQVSTFLRSAKKWPELCQISLSMSRYMFYTTYVLLMKDMLQIAILRVIRCYYKCFSTTINTAPCWNTFAIYHILPKWCTISSQPPGATLFTFPQHHQGSFFYNSHYTSKLFNFGFC